MTLPTLYKYTKTGQTQQWSIIVRRNTYYTIEGIYNLTESKPTICQGKNIGRANETTPEQQALNEAQSKWQKKIDKGYSIGKPQKISFFEPMLAHKKEQYEKLLFTVPTWVQPKLDGVRCILQHGKLISRNNKPIVSCPHFEVPGYFLDGELYNHEYKNDFNKIISLTRKTKPTKEDLKEAEEKVQYWVYDNPNHSGLFSERLLALPSLPSGMYKVSTYSVKDKDELKFWHESFLADGFEGTMIRLDLGPYESKRSKQLLKYKEFQDDEFIILDVIEGQGNRSGMAGALMCKIGDSTFNCSMTGNQDFMKQVLKDREKIIGLEATVKYFELTPDGIPRFPTLKHIIGYETK